MSRKSWLVLLLVFAVPALADVPPFGTVVGQWNLGMSGAYAGAGVTWRRSSNELYLMDQGYSGNPGVWKLDPRQPAGSIQPVLWQFANMGGPTEDIPFSLAWDGDSGCFWVTQFEDGSLYDTVWMLRYVEEGGRWSCREQPGDTWMLGTGPAGNYVRGLEKWPDRGYFIGTVPHTSGSFVKFNPYTKTIIGRFGPRDSLWGCALVPWDSAYILSTFAGGDSNSFNKYDSAGTLKQRASAMHPVADWSVVMPQLLVPDDTVFAFCMTSNTNNTLQRVSTGLTWGQLPSVLVFNVRPVAILAPVGVVDSGEAVVPEISVQNQSDVQAQNVRVHFLVEDEADVVLYHDSVTTNLLPHTQTTVEFDEWTADGDDSVDIRAWTFWASDSNPEDDTLEGRLLVRVTDIALVQITAPVPWDTLDSAAVVTPGCRVQNRGNMSMSFPMLFGRHGQYDTTMVTGLAPQESRTIAGPGPWSMRSGAIDIRFSAEVPEDIRPGNNDSTFLVWVEGSVSRDMGVVSFSPCTVRTGDTVIPRITVKNHGRSPEDFKAFLRILDSLGAEVYSESMPLSGFPPGMQTVLVLPEKGFPVAGRYLAACSVYCAPDQNVLNDFRTDTIRVGVGPGISSGGGADIPVFGLAVPTCFRRQLTVGYSLGTAASAELAVYTTTGRRVASLGVVTAKPGVGTAVWSGRDDSGREVSAGVYHIRFGSGDRTASRKVVKLE